MIIDLVSFWYLMRGFLDETRNVFTDDRVYIFGNGIWILRNANCKKFLPDFGSFNPVILAFA